MRVNKINFITCEEDIVFLLFVCLSACLSLVSFREKKLKLGGPICSVNF